MNLVPRLLRSLARSRSLLAFASLLAAAAVQGAPAHVLIRVPAGRTVPAGLPRLLARWQATGQVERVLLLTDTKPERHGAQALFGALAVLEFRDDNACVSWWKDDTAALPPGLIVRQADVLLRGATPSDGPGHPVYLVNTYTPTVPAAPYDAFVQGYIKPLYAAMQATGHLVGYTMYLERGETGRMNAFSVLEYRDAAALAAMPPLKRRIRAQLLANTPGYAHYDPIKGGLRGDDGGTFAVPTTWAPTGPGRAAPQ
ncbi:MAG TPA: hypothetical protein VHE61_12430 [Opitutaceae bacterium]|nr:hypothetical protein [Opitutaceae bacterium]